MATIKLNEEQLYQLIKESVEETMLDEGLWDNLKAGFRGMKQGYQAQKSIDDNDKRKPHWDRQDYDQQAHGLTAPRKTAEMEVNDIYYQIKEYFATINKLQAKRKKLAKEYNLVPIPGTNLYRDPTPNPQYSGTMIPGSTRTSGVAVAARH